MGKVTLISDFVYGSIEISDLEKKVLSTRIFNRLHNVLQTSTAYLTYPTLRTTRFSHSIGAMHLASGIFSHGFENATIEDKEQFLLVIKNEVDLLISKNNNSISVFKYKWQNLQCEFLLNNLPNGVVFSNNDAYAYAYLVVFQALRLSTLIHDLGHPPFSHVVERFYQQIRRLPLHNSHSGHKIKKIFNRFDDTIPMHEQLGEFLTKALLDEILIKNVYDDAPDFENHQFNCLVSKFSTKITNAGAQSNPVFAALHTIISSDLDADRMDYVSRDYFISGLVGSPIRYDRLLSSYTLKSNEGMFGFYPSVRALNTLENYFQSRFNLYKHALYHHRVAKTDALLEYCLSAIVKRYLENETNNFQKKKEYYLDVTVENLWQVLEFIPQDNSEEIFIDRLSQWDDAWMLSLLRKEYYILVEKGKQFNLTKEEHILSKRLGELLSNRKNYYSLYKRMDSMLEFEEAVIDAYGEDATKPLKNKHVMREPQMVEKIITLFNNPKIKNEIQETSDIIDSMIVKKKMNAGISDHNQFLLVKDDALVELDRISSLRKELNESLDLMPQYYIFVLFKEGTEKAQELHQLRRKIGWIIGKNLK